MGDANCNIVDSEPMSEACAASYVNNVMKTPVVQSVIECKQNQTELNKLCTEQQNVCVSPDSSITTTAGVHPPPNPSNTPGGGLPVPLLAPAEKTARDIIRTTVDVHESVITDTVDNQVKTSEIPINAQIIHLQEPLPVNANTPRKRRHSEENDQDTHPKKLKTLSKVRAKKKSAPKKVNPVAKPKKQTLSKEKAQGKDTEATKDNTNDQNFLGNAFDKLSSQILTVGLQLTERMDKLEKSLEDKITKKLSNKLTLLVNKKVDDSLEEMKRDMSKELEKIKKSVTDMKKSYSEAVNTPKDAVNSNNENNDLNVVIKNLPISDAEKDDPDFLINNVNALLINGLHLVDVKITKANRKPARQNQKGDNRPGIIIATLGSIEQKESLMSKKCELKHSRDYNKVYIQNECNAESRQQLHNLTTLIKEMDMSDRIGARFVNGVAAVVPKDREYHVNASHKNDGDGPGWQSTNHIPRARRSDDGRQYNRNVVSNTRRENRSPNYTRNAFNQDRDWHNSRSERNHTRSDRYSAETNNYSSFSGTRDRYNDRSDRDVRSDRRDSRNARSDRYHERSNNHNAGFNGFSDRNRSYSRH